MRKFAYFAGKVKVFESSELVCDSSRTNKLSMIYSKLYFSSILSYSYLASIYGIIIRVIRFELFFF